MVQILPPKYNVGEQIGQSLQGGLERGMQFGFQRGMLQNAFQKVKELSSNPNATPLERTGSILEAFSLIPGSERYVGQILPTLNQMAAFQGEQPQPGGMRMPNQPIMGGSSQKSSLPPKIVNGEVVPEPTEMPFSDEDIDLYEPFLGKGIKKFSPQEISSREYQDLSKGLPSSPVADYMRKQNGEIESAVDKISERQNSFANYYNSIHPNADPDDQRIAQRFYRSKDALKAPTNSEKAKIVDNFLDRYKALKTNIANQLPRNLVGKVRGDQEKEIRNQIQWLLDEDQRDLAKQFITDNLGFGDSESERIIREPTKEENSLLSNFEKFPELNIKVPTFGKSARLFQTYSNERIQKIDDYSKRLESAIKPGTAKKPGLSLLVARDMAMDSTGMSWVEFNDIINNLLKNGKIKLDPYQSQELPKLTNPPHAGFMDMIINRK